MPEKSLPQMLYEEVKNIRDIFQEERSKWYWDEIEWKELEKTAEELIKQLKEVKNKYKIDWTKLKENERYLPSALSCLEIELGMYVGPRNLKSRFDED